MEIHRVVCSSATGGPPSLGLNSDCRRLVDCEEEEEEEEEEEICMREATILHDHSNGGASSSEGSPSPSPSLQDAMDSSTEGASGCQSQQNPVKQWSYEEQFRQLYNLSDESDRKDFLDKLFDYMAKKGTPITRIPIMAKQPLDMYKLFKLVVERGGLVEVIKKKAWRDIAKELNLPASITSAAFTMRSQYVKYLYPYECEVESLSDPKELQLAIESNKRDRRHSDNIEYIQHPGSTGRETERREALVSQPAYAVTGTPSGLHLISSPGTVALPHSNMPPYSGGFIITPSGHHIVHTPRMTTAAAPQLLQMGAAHPQLPIVVPSTTLPGASPLATAMIPLKSESSSPSLTDRKGQDERETPTPPPPQIPVLFHTAAGLQAALTPGQSGGMIHMTGGGELPLERRHEISVRERVEQVEEPPAKKMAIDTSSSGTDNAISSSRMPFTNISIKPTTGANNLETSPSILVQIELNNIIYQGVLFARPIHASQTLSSPPPR
ncbi:PREDICTED: AT-rich interactive domain-containing protein 3A-like [Amphimedon queenslandica]|uniref:ARID domain-containing protein n=1 Tax=Amphimedon queenslandica TaxID=400682 RepID=A0A1X7U1L0_AMPQE|nr:PREDICTED: AT-rich interactive domain-containing protein 3A-like [Amphimedon queenslandica]|eukprot:XP_011406312.1 PREDICTED: AT-rich interactive domain-containing protein 3A-like [Amphimedon queenslandica]